MSLSNNLTLLLNQQDSNGVNILNRTIGAISFIAVAGEIESKVAPDTSQHTLDLPTALILQVYLNNLSTTANLTLVGTPQGGSSATLAVIPPGGVYIYWADKTSGSAGYTQLKLTSDTTNEPYEIFLGG